MSALPLPSPASWWSEWTRGWNRFWFTPTDPATLSLIRILAGAMLLYAHAVWSLDLWAFLGPEGWLPGDILREQILDDRPFVWSYFFWIDSPGVLWAVHLASLVVFAMLTVGLFSRVAAVLGYIAAVAYAQRITPGVYFGLDQINCMLVMYLMLGPCGARYSVDRWLQTRRSQRNARPRVEPSTAANIAVRLIQIHMCIIYFFSGLAKLTGSPFGAAWWDGTAVWWAVAIPEYQSIDMTWLAGWPVLVAVLTYVTVFWELTYAALVWPRATRPVVLAVAVGAHGGIAIFLGMITFGLAMLIGNLAFVPPEVVRQVFDRNQRD